MAFSELELIINYDYESADPLLVDVGAHHGVVTLAFANKGWRVLAFEPETNNRAAFIENTKNQMKVKCFNLAVSDVSGQKLPFFVSKEHYGIHALKPFHETHEFAYEVESTTLDDILPGESVRSVTTLKVDTEGADFLALKGFNLDRYQPELVMVEFMDERSEKNYQYSHHDMIRYMSDKGYFAFVSEWMPIKEYGREGEKSDGHTWVKCGPYEPGSSPNWGNVIFVPNSKKQSFSDHLDRFLAELEAKESASQSQSSLKKAIKSIPGWRFLRRLLRKYMRTSRGKNINNY